MVTIQETKTTDELVHKYPGQSDPQPCYVELDLRDGVMLADWNSEIGNAIPFTVYHGHVQRYSIPSLTADAANALMQELLPLAERVVDGYKSVWNGNNNVARLTDDASEANDAIDDRCQQEFDGADVLEHVPADNWYNDFSDDIADKTDEELEAIARDAGEAALKDGYVVEGMFEALRDIRKASSNTLDGQGKSA